MNRYLIKNKIETVAELPKPFEFEGYTFTSYSVNWWDCNAWIASKEIEAPNIIEARKNFVEDLIPIIEKCSVISQCAFKFHATSYFIYKLTNNPEMIIFLYLVDNVGHTGLHFDEECIEQLPKMVPIPNQQAFMYLMDSTNATTYYTRLAMLFCAIESLSGQVTTKRGPRINRIEGQKILGNQLYDKLFSHGKGLRNKLLHGHYSSHNLFNGLSELIYKKILGYLSNNFNINFDQNVVHPQRNFSDNYTALQISMKFVSKPLLDLNEVEIVMSERRKSRVKQSDILSYVNKLPSDY